jgi:molybdopterin synthase sulfur carrier subunit
VPLREIKGGRTYYLLRPETDVVVISITIHTIIGLKEILGQEVIEFPIPEGTTVKALLALMVDKWGARLSSYFSDAEQDRPLPKIRIVVNGRDIGFLQGMETELRDGDEILMLPLVGGG